MAILERIAQIERIQLDSGSHQPPTGPDDIACCVMEAVSYVAGEPWTDHPKCASPILTSFLIAWNDRLDDQDRQILKPYIPRLVGTNTGQADETTRRYMLTDWVVHEAMPGLLRQANMTDHATLLEQLVAITDPSSYEAAREVLSTIYDATWEARSAWRERIRQAVRDEIAKQGKPAVAAVAAVAEVAAAVAALAVAAEVAAVAALAAASTYGGRYDAAYEAAYPIFKAAFDEKLGDTNRGLQASALLLLDRLITVSQTEMSA